MTLRQRMLDGRRLGATFLGAVRTCFFAVALAVGAAALQSPAAALTADEKAYEEAGVPFSQGDYATARKLYLALLERQDRLGFAPDDLHRLAVLFQLARCEHALGDERAAYDHLGPVIANIGRMQGAEPSTLLIMLDLQAKVTNDLARWAEEEAALARALALFTPNSGLTALDRIDIELRRSVALMRLDRLDEGRALRRATLRDQAASPALAREVSANLNFVGNLLANAGFGEDAVEVFREQLTLLGGQPTMPLAVSHFNLAIALRNLHRLDEAIEANRKAVDLLEQVSGAKDRRTIRALGGLGQTYDFAGQYVAAGQWLGEAYDRARKHLGADDPDTALYANNLADVHRNLGNLKEAERLDREALATRQRRLGENSGDTHASRDNLVIDLQLLGRYGEASDMLRPLLDRLAATLGADHQATWDVRRRIAGLDLSAGRLDEAEKEFAAIGDERVTPRQRVYLLNARAHLAEKKGRTAEGLALREQTLRLARETLGADHPDTLQFLADVVTGRTDGVTADLDELNARVVDWARREVAATADPQTRQRLLSLFSTTRNLMVDNALRHPGPESHALLVTAMERWKGVGLREDQLLARLSVEGGDERTMALARELAKRGAAGTGAAGTGAAGAGAANGGGAGSARLAELRAKLAAASPAYAQARRSAEVSAADIAAALRPGELLLDYWVVPASAQSARGHDSVVAALIAPDGVRAVRRLEAIGPLSDVASIEVIFANRYFNFDYYRDYVAPFAAEIAGAKKLFVSADGPLHVMPFEALRTPRGRYLVEELNVEMVRSGASLAAARKSSAQSAARTGVIIADAIDYGRGPKGETPIRPLSGNEGTAVAAVLRGSVFAPVKLVSGRAASKRWLQSLRAPRILHLSTHGTYRASASVAENPLTLGAIALAGANKDYGRGNSGILTAAEAMGLKLDGSDLVVLSACETARGGATYAEGLAGLPSALAIAGARRTLLALWPVSDPGAAAFMRRFYRHLVRTPDDYAGALRATKLDAIAGRLSPAAADWKAFVLIRN